MRIGGLEDDTLNYLLLFCIETIVYCILHKTDVYGVMCSPIMAEVWHNMSAISAG